MCGCCVFSECCGSGAANVGLWDNCERAGGLCQEASPRKVSFTTDQLHHFKQIIIKSLFLINFSRRFFLLRFLWPFISCDADPPLLHKQPHWAEAIEPLTFKSEEPHHGTIFHALFHPVCILEGGRSWGLWGGKMRHLQTPPLKSPQ